MDIVIRQWAGPPDEGLLGLYESVGWGAYCEGLDLQEAFVCSVCVLTAFAGELPVGLIRAVGDGVSVLLVQEILVRPGYRRRGVGTRLLAQVFHRYKNVRQIFVITDERDETVAFYQAVGFAPAQRLHYRAFCRLRYQ